MFLIIVSYVLIHYSIFKNLIEMSWFVGTFKVGISLKYLLLLTQILGFVTEDTFNIKFYIFYNKFRH